MKKLLKLLCISVIFSAFNSNKLIQGSALPLIAAAVLANNNQPTDSKKPNSELKKQEKLAAKLEQRSKKRQENRAQRKIKNKPLKK